MRPRRSQVVVLVRQFFQDGSYMDHELACPTILSEKTEDLAALVIGNHVRGICRELSALDSSVQTVH